MAVEIVSYTWTFGDGAISHEQNTGHVYFMPGKYEWSLVVVLSNGLTLTDSGVVYIYDQDYSYTIEDGVVVFSGLITSRTDKCFRFAIPGRIEQGLGWCVYDGLSWPFPIGEVGKCRIKDENEEFRQCVIDGEDFKVHELGIDNQWQDGADEYAGVEIESEILQKEETPPMGASAIFDHEQSHAYVKPFDKQKRSVDDYNSEGFRTVFNMDAYIRVDSKITDAALTRKVPFKGQLVFDKQSKSPNLQIGWILRGAPWRFVKTQTWYKQIDSAASPPNKLMSEMSWALELQGLMSWLARNILTPLMDSATGIEASGSITSTTTGPDTYNSGLVLSPADTLTILNIGLSGDFSIVVWLRNLTTPLTLITIGTFVITITAAGVINITDGVNTVNINLNQNYAAWTQLGITREENVIRVYEKGSLTNTAVVGSIEAISGNMIISGACSLSDLRVKSNAASNDSILYHYEDMINNKGNSTCPII